MKFPNAGGVQRGSPVRVAGVTVGAGDRRFDLSGPRSRWLSSCARTCRTTVRTTSRATIGSVSLLGEGAVDITASTTGEPIPECGYVPSAPPPAQLADVTAQAEQGHRGADGAHCTDIRAGKGTVGKLMTDEQLYAELQQFTAAAREVTEGLAQGKGTLGSS